MNPNIPSRISVILRPDLLTSFCCLSLQGVVKSGSKTTKMKTGDITDMVCKRLQQTCDAIASHVYEVSPQKYRIDSMRLGFKKDHLGNLWWGPL